MRSARILEVVGTIPHATALYRRRQGFRTVQTVRRVAFRVSGFHSAALMLKQL